MTFPQTPEQHPDRYRRRDGCIEQAFWLSPGEIRALRLLLARDQLTPGWALPYTRECLESVRDKLLEEE